MNTHICNNIRAATNSIVTVYGLDKTNIGLELCNDMDIKWRSAQYRNYLTLNADQASLCLLQTQRYAVSTISRTLVGNKIVDHSDVVGASPVGAAPTTYSFSTWHLASVGWAKTTARRDEKHLCFGIWSTCIRDLTVTYHNMLKYD